MGLIFKLEASGCPHWAEDYITETFWNFGLFVTCHIFVQDLKKLREKRLAELDQQMRDAEEECQKVRNNIGAAEFLLKEKKKLFSLTYQPPDDPQGSPRSPPVDPGKVTESPRTVEKSVRRSMSSSVPHFMTSTVCSRQRQGVDGDISGRSRTPRSGNRHLNDLFRSQSQSQSLSYSDHYLKSSLRSSRNNKKSMLAEANSPRTEHSNCNPTDLRSSSIPRSKRVSMSHPNLRVTLGHHRRRMSDFSWRKKRTLKSTAVKKWACVWCGKGNSFALVVIDDGISLLVWLNHVFSSL